MLTDPKTQPSPKPVRPSYVRRLWHESRHNTMTLGCHICPDKELCGGLQVRAALMDCTRFCCDNPTECDQVCRKNPVGFVERVREIGGFDLNTVPHGKALDPPFLPASLPVVFHGKRRSIPIATEAVALPLYAMFNRRTGEPRFWSGSALRAAFLIAPETTILLTGTDQDPPLERWWSLGESGRRRIIRALIGAVVVLATVPNYSLILNRPRWDDLYAIKRIGLVHYEFLDEGLPGALHINGRTDTDFRRWTDYLIKRPEITHIAYEFRTMSGRQETHVEWLVGVARAVGRRLHLIVRGGTQYFLPLSTAFTNITFLDTTVFMKTVNRQRAYRTRDGGVHWKRHRTKEGAPLDKLLSENADTRAQWLSELAAKAAK